LFVQCGPRFAISVAAAVLLAAVIWSTSWSRTSRPT